MNYRIFILGLSIIFAMFFSFPTLFNTDSGKKINLGLDLQGGMYMLLGVNVEEAVENKVKSIAQSIKYNTNKNDILIEDLQLLPTSVEFSLLSSVQKMELEKILLEQKEGEVKNNGLKYSITLTNKEVQQTKDFAVVQTVERVRNRLDQFGLAEPTVVKQGKTDIVVQLPGIKTLQEEQRSRDLISKPGNLQMMEVDEEKMRSQYSWTSLKLEGTGSIKLPNIEGGEIILKEIPILTGDNIKDSRVMFDESNQPMISFDLDSFGAKVFGDFTGNNVGKRLAIVLDGKVYSAPVIKQRIGGGSGQISGNFTIEEAGNVSIALKSGALPASITMLEKRSVGPSLGADSIKASMIALISGFVCVIIFMYIYYRRVGLVSNLVLIVNVLLIIAIMSLFGATLTLPGMAGIVLTVGMAVDANVIINERIREGLIKGKKVKEAIEEGYDNAIRAILDANITTLLVAIILYAYGTGPIKGFAITISIGILVSMLTAILGTHGIYQLLGKKIDRQKHWFGV